MHGPSSLPSAVSTLSSNVHGTAQAGLRHHYAPFLTPTNGAQGLDTGGQEPRFHIQEKHKLHAPQGASLSPPYTRGSLLPSITFTQYNLLTPPHSFHTSSVPTGAGNVESTETLPPPSGSQAARGDGQPVEWGHDEAPWRRSLTQPWVRGTDSSQCR